MSEKAYSLPVPASYVDHYQMISSKINMSVEEVPHHMLNEMWDRLERLENKKVPLDEKSKTRLKIEEEADRLLKSSEGAEYLWAILTGILIVSTNIMAMADAFNAKVMHSHDPWLDFWMLIFAFTSATFFVIYAWFRKRRYDRAERKILLSQ